MAVRTTSASCLAGGGIPTGFCPIAQGCGNDATLGWNITNPPIRNPNGVASFPNKPFVPFHTVFAEKHPVFVLKR
jgi:hypothetical protein